MSEAEARNRQELARLRGGQTGPLAAPLLLVSVVASGGRGMDVLRRARAVMEAVLAQEDPDVWPNPDGWRVLLPQEFVSACAPEQTQAEAEASLKTWRQLTREEQAVAERQKRWSLENWLYWMKPGERSWYWWDAHLSSESELVVRVVVEGLPAPLGALSWLLRSSGATQVEFDR